VNVVVVRVTSEPLTSKYAVSAVSGAKPLPSVFGTTKKNSSPVP
jgi:hypothetical protein